MHDSHGWVRRQRGVQALALAGLALAACSSPSPTTVESAPKAIVGGTNAPLCAWPTVVLVGDGCTGTLVHPQVVITAAHCVDGNEGPVPTTVAFGENALNSPTKTVKISKCAPSPKYASGDTDDIGYCVLAQAVTDVPVVPAMAACEASVLKAGVDILEVGYGQSAVKSGTNDGFGVKRFIAATINAVNSNGQINVTTGNQNGEYYGDSGGPIFVQMTDKTWRFIGADCCSADIVSGSTSPRVSTYTSAPHNLAWLESSSGFDLTPCHDGSTWNPGTLCSTLPTTPDKASGGWSTMCASSQGLTAPQATCTVPAGTGGTSGAGGAAAAGGVTGTPGAGGTAGPGAGGASGAGGAGGKPGDAGTSADATAKADATGDDVNPNSKGGDSGAGGSMGAGGAGASGGAAGGSAGNSGAGGSAKGGATGTGGAASSGGSVAANGGSSAGKGGSAGTGGTHSDAGADTKGASVQGSSGCSCSLWSPAPRVPWPAFLAAVAIMALRQARRRRG